MFQRADEYNFQDEVSGCLSTRRCRENKVCVCPQWCGDVRVSGGLWLPFRSAVASFLSLRGESKVTEYQDGGDLGQPSEPPSSHLMALEK